MAGVTISRGSLLVAGTACLTIASWYGVYYVTNAD
jgi:hypothetical protein